MRKNSRTPNIPAPAAPASRKRPAKAGAPKSSEFASGLMPETTPADRPIELATEQSDEVATQSSGARQEVVEHDALEHIRRAAYGKWIEAGCPPGDGVEYWLAAERDYLEQNKMPDPSGSSDVVQEASEESFPASDPPAWGSSRRASAVR